MTIEAALSPLTDTYPAPPALDAGDIHVRWVMPEIFHDLPVREADDDMVVQLLGDLVDRALPKAEEEDKARVGAVCALAVADLRSAGADYAALCLTAVEQVPCTATVMATLVGSPEVVGGPRAVTRSIASDLRRTGTGEIAEVELPCGFAVTDIGSRESKLTGDLTDTGESIGFSAWYIRVYAPLPNDVTFVIEMETPTPAGWDVFSTMFGNTVSSIRLYDASGSRLITSEAAT